MELTQNCGAILTSALPLACGRDKIEEARFAVLWAYNTSITAAGTIPTAAELQAFITAGNAFVIRFSNGVLAPENVAAIAETDTESGLPEFGAATQTLTGIIRNFNNKLRKMLASTNLNNQLMQLGWVSNDGRFHGEKTGYTVPVYFPDFDHAGQGGQAGINISFTWKKAITEFKEYSGVDADYLTLQNVDMIGTYTVANVVGTTGDCIEGYEGITAWNKTTYPTLYAKYVNSTTTISFYSSDAARTAGTGTAVLATVDVSAGETVTQANASGFGGTIDIVKVDFTDADTWNVTYS